MRTAASRFRVVSRLWGTVSFLMFLVLGLFPGTTVASSASYSRVRLRPGDRLLVLAPHPDDEVAGCGGLILRAVEEGIPVRVVFLTNGDSNEGAFLAYRGHPVVAPSAVIAMGRTREEEARKAESVLGVAASNISFLGYPDRGTLAIWLAHWAARPPLRGLLTRATSVPYAIASRPGAPYKGGAVLADLERAILMMKPTKICLSTSADRHPDHAALYLFTRVALWDLGAEPDLLPYLVHYPKWPQRAKSAKSVEIAPPPEIASEMTWRVFPVLPPERKREYQALLQHRSQIRSVRKLLSRLVDNDELFGNFANLTLSRLAIPGHGLTTVLPFRARWPRSGPGDLRMGLSASGSHLFLEVPAPEPHVGRIAIDIVGYSPERPFPTMPKIEIRVSEAGIEIYNDGLREGRNRGAIARLGSTLRVSLPVSLLGAPDRLLLSARSSSAHLLIDETPWRVVWLNGGRDPHWQGARSVLSSAVK